MIISFLPYLSLNPGLIENLNANVASVTSNFRLGLSLFQCTAGQSLTFFQNKILRVFLLILSVVFQFLSVYIFLFSLMSLSRLFHS